MAMHTNMIAIENTGKSAEITFKTHLAVHLSYGGQFCLECGTEKPQTCHH